MASNRREYYKKNRKRIKRDLKNTLNGVLSACFGCVCAILFFVSIGRSFAHDGVAGPLLGTIGLFGLVFAVGALVLGFFAFKEPNIRPALPRLGTILGAILTVVYVVLYVMGAMAV